MKTDRQKSEGVGISRTKGKARQILGMEARRTEGKEGWRGKKKKKIRKKGKTKGRIVAKVLGGQRYPCPA